MTLPSTPEGGGKNESSERLRNLSKPHSGWVGLEPRSVWLQSLCSDLLTSPQKHMGNQLFSNNTLSMEGLLCAALRGLKLAALLLLRSLVMQREARRCSPSKGWHIISSPWCPLAPRGAQGTHYSIRANSPPPQKTPTPVYPPRT